MTNPEHKRGEDGVPAAAAPGTSTAFHAGRPVSEKDEQASLVSLTDRVYAAFRASERRRTLVVRLTQIGMLAAFLLLWEAASRLKWIDGLLFSSPKRIGQLLYEKLLDGSLLLHTGVTVWETIVGFLLGTLLGTAIAALLWFSPFLSRVLDPYIVVLNSLPKVALGPLFIVALGPGALSIVATTLSITVIITILVIYNSFRAVEPQLLRVVQLFGAGRATVFRKVILPAAHPTIISTLKVNVGLSWVGVIVGEFLVSKQGLGYLIIYGFQVFNFTLVIGSVVIIAVAATVMYQGVAYLESKLVRK